MPNETELMAIFEHLPITDDFIFRKVMEDSKLCQEVLERLLNRPIGELQEVTPQRSFKRTKDGKEIRLDIYSKSNAAVFDTEMQNLGNRTLESLSLPKRGRFYQSEIDSDNLDKGVAFNALPENNVIFICTFDPFDENEPVYVFENVHLGKKTIPLKDGTYKYFFNLTYQGDDIPKSLNDLYRYMRSGEPTDTLTEKMAEAVKIARQNKEWRSEYMRASLFEYDCIEEGKAIEHVHTVEAEKRAEKAENRASKAENHAKDLEQKLKEAYELLEKNGIKPEM